MRKKGWYDMDSSSSRAETALETVIIFAAQMEALARFYRDALGIGPFEASPGHLGCHVGPVYLGFDQVEPAGEAGAKSGVTLWFTVDDIEATFARLVELGAAVRYRPTRKPWGALLASVHDPEGNVLGLSQREP
jgi:predicted enzyme related to lactoylglutathione lyase